MAAHAATTASGPLLPAPRRHPIRRPALRPLLVLAAATATVLIAWNADAVASVATDICTAGTEPGTTCGEALYSLGFPS